MAVDEEHPELLPGMARASVKASQAKAKATRARKAAQAEPAAVDPVARVLVDLPLAHLDRPFDYAVPASMSEAAVAGVRVKVRFAGQDVDGFLVERRATSDHPGRLTPLRRVVSAEPVLSPAVATLTEAVARRWAGTGTGRGGAWGRVGRPRHRAGLPRAPGLGRLAAGRVGSRPRHRLATAGGPCGRGHDGGRPGVAGVRARPRRRRARRRRAVRG